MPDIILKTENLTKKTEIKLRKSNKNAGDRTGENKKDKYVVNHVSLTLNRGDIYGLIGTDDSGKAMFLRLVCGLTKPTEGSVSLFGATGERQLQKARKTVGSMVGNPVFYRDLSALENLIVQSRYFRHPVSKEEMWELLEQVGLEDAGHRRVGAFSAGMRRQLGIALALVGKPELVILDEPYLKVEDEKLEQIRSFLLKLNRERGLSILFCSVMVERFPGLATRYGFLHEGRLVRELCEENAEKEQVKGNEADTAGGLEEL